jgi:starch synthase
LQASVHRTVARGGQFVLLGSGHLEGAFRAMAEGQYRGSDAVRLLTMYSNALSHLIYAAADLVLVPSMFEPCGLTQMIAMRYGAVPLVRRTGGLADTVHDVARDEVAGNGYVFDGSDEGALFGALDRALSDYQAMPDWWQQLSVANMRRELGWAQPAEQYVRLYRAAQQM